MAVGTSTGFVAFFQMPSIVLGGNREVCLNDLFFLETED